MERAVRRDIRDAGSLPAGARSLAEIALILARAIDEPGGNLATKAKLAQELRVTLGQLREVVRDSVGDSGEAGQPHTPVWDAPQPGAADVGAAGSGGRAQAG